MERIKKFVGYMNMTLFKNLNIRRIRIENWDA